VSPELVPRSEPESVPELEPEPMIVFDGVTKRFGEHVVLRELDFTVAPGEHVCLIGPSGSGKTTILRLLMTLEKVDGGTIRVGGQCLSHMERKGVMVPADDRHCREVRKRIGMVFQQFNLFPNMKVLQNITEAPIQVLGLSKEEAEQRAMELLEMVDLADKAGAHPTTLSGGQQQRVAIARALAMRPDVLLLDEVTSALDPEIAAEVLDVLRNIAKTSDVTMLCVTHAMKFARDVSHRVLMFNEGKIIEDASPEQIFNEPRHERTKSFLRSVIDES
jgi:polar amino acid transport system ATP-binding protein